MARIQSDFHIIPIKHKNDAGWEWRHATWNIIKVDPKVHLLFDEKCDEPITYKRKRWKDKKMQNCAVYRMDDTIIMDPGDDCLYEVKRVSENNRDLQESQSKDNSNDNCNDKIDKCEECKRYDSTHMMQDCNHICLCDNCATNLYDNDTKTQCPKCSVDVTKPPLKIIFNKKKNRRKVRKRVRRNYTSMKIKSTTSRNNPYVYVRSIGHPSSTADTCDTANTANNSLINY